MNTSRKMQQLLSGKLQSILQRYHLRVHGMKYTNSIAVKLVKVTGLGFMAFNNNTVYKKCTTGYTGFL